METLPFPREAVRVVRASEALASLTSDIEQVVVGPGPMDPERAGLIPLVHEVARRGLPYLGVCLGHQALGLAFGASLFRSTPSHGKRGFAQFLPSRRFSHVSGRVEVMRYHSLSLRGVKSPLNVIASLEDGTVMAIEHESLPMAGVQFHPDSFGTPRGRELLRNSLSLRSGERVEVRAGEGPKVERVTLSEVARSDEFALLSPQFTRSDHWSLISLQSETPNVTLWHAKAEGQSVAARGELKAVELQFDVEPSPLDPQLDDREFLEGVASIRESIA
ncbi:MAG: aminodeoxychorismate/anthranilate synthase component II, partial [Archangium sp.]|nr:aminodeoxychorismate/anthranilate synthase component II [Archangium sp.]